MSIIPLNLTINPPSERVDFDDSTKYDGLVERWGSNTIPEVKKWKITFLFLCLRGEGREG